jgi:uncharacterized protein (TIGR02300 family)
MAKAELGVKRRCLTCSAPFFDLNRTPIVCPKCAAVFQVVEVQRSSFNYSRMRPAAFKERDSVPADTAVLDEEKEDVDSDLPETEQDGEMDETEVVS